MKAGSLRLTPRSRDGREKRSVGFDEEPVQGDFRSRFPEISGLGKSQNAREGYEKSQIDHPEGEFRVFREAVKNAAPGGPLFADGGQDVGSRKPAVDDDGKIELPGEPELLPEGRPLFPGRRRNRNDSPGRFRRRRGSPRYRGDV